MIELVENAKALIEIDRNVVRALVENDFKALPDLIMKFRELKINVLSGLNEFSVIEGLDEPTKEILTRAQREFPTDHIIDGDSFYELSDEEAWKIGSDLLYSWISHYEYVRNMFKINIIILKTTIPASLRRYISEARNCFALEQYNATISMCRTILEAAVKDLCERKGFFNPPGDNVSEINPKVFNQLLRSVSWGKLKRRAIKMYYRDACPVVHGDRLVKSDDALRVLKETSEIIQDLYSTNGG